MYNESINLDSHARVHMCAFVRHDSVCAYERKCEPVVYAARTHVGAESGARRVAVALSEPAAPDRCPAEWHINCPVHSS